VSYIELAIHDVEEDLVKKIKQTVTWQVCSTGTKTAYYFIEKNPVFTN